MSGVRFRFCPAANLSIPWSADHDFESGALEMEDVSKDSS